MENFTIAADTGDTLAETLAADIVEQRFGAVRHYMYDWQ
jgi:hypothetical protein